MALLTVTKLMETLHAAGLVDAPITAREWKKGKQPKGWSDETYGKQSFLFYHASKDDPKLLAIRNALYNAGVNWVPRWNDGNGLQIPVAYFKGWHWDE